MAGIVCTECAVPGTEQTLNNYHHRSTLWKGLDNMLFLGRHRVGYYFGAILILLLLLS